jgi:hypothetical protein
MKWVGIDPGLSGGIALLDYDAVGNLKVAQPMPIPTLKSAKTKTGRVYDVPQLSKIFCAWGVLGAFATLEKSQAMPKQGVSSTFSIGYGFGVLEALLVAHNIRYQVVRPQQWQKVMLASSNKKNTKEASILIAKRLFPNINLIKDGCRKDHDGMADALLMAEYSRRSYESTK